MKWIALILLLLVSCKENVLEIQEEPYTHRWWAFYEIKLPVAHVGRPMKFALNGRFTNISKSEYEDYPIALVAYGRQNKEKKIYAFEVIGGLGYTETEDWGMLSTHEERFQPLSILRKSVKPKETLRIKVLSPWFTPPDTVFITLIHVVNGVRDIPRDQVTW